MGALDRLGPIVFEPRRKVRIKYAPVVANLEFTHVVVWDASTKYYVPIVGVVSPDDGEVLDHFSTVDPDGNSFEVFARQFDTKLFIIEPSLLETAVKLPGAGNTCHFHLEQI